MKHLDALASERQHNATLRRIIAGIVVLGCVGMYLTFTLPKNINLHLAPDMRAGQTIAVTDGVAPVPPVNVYSFAYYIWQQLNRWQSDGAKNYAQQLFDFQSYVTPMCQAQIRQDIEARMRLGQLTARTRAISEIPGFPYSPERVVNQGPSAWTVLLDMQLTETYKGQAIKDTFIRYPIRVVRFDVDRERNPWGLAIDCFGTLKPSRLDPATVSTRKPAALPDTIQPPALPRAD